MNKIVFLFLPLLLFGYDPLPSWNEGPAKQAILNFVQQKMPEEEKIAVFDQDGTLWVEQPIYPQLVYCFDKVGTEPAMDLSDKALEEIVVKALTGMPVEQFQNEVREWLKTARHPRWDRPYTDLTYLPMQEVLRLFRDHGFKTYIVTGGGQDFVRVFADATYGIPREQVIGTAAGVKYEYDREGNPFLTKDAKLLLNDNYAGKPQGIHLMIGRRPVAAFGNSIGDRQMLEFTNGLAMLVHHDDPIREYAYGPDSKVGTFTQALQDEALKKGWIIISMKNDWKKIFSFE